MKKTQNKKSQRKNEKNTYSFARLLSTELKYSFTPAKILGMLIGGILFPFLIYFIAIFINGSKSTILLISIASQSVAFFIFSRITSTVQEKATIDKNKATFIYYGKNKVTAAKLFCEFIMFSIGYFVLFGFGLIAAKSNSNSIINDSDYLIASLKILPGYAILHMFIYTLAKWAISFIPKKGLSYAAALLISISLLVPIFILNQIPETSILLTSVNQGGTSLAKNWFAQHQFASTFIPYVNFGIISGVGVEFKGFGLLEEQWYVVIPILYCIIGLASIWNLQSGAQKRYLSQ